VWWQVQAGSTLCAMEIICVLAIVLVFEFAALRWGFDSRDSFRIPRDKLGE